MFTQADLETPRTSAAMLPWVLDALESFGVSHELKVAAREGKYFAGELTDEALPIALFAYRYFRQSPDVTITHVLGNQGYDATVADNRLKPSAVRFIETTLADRDYEDSLRLEILSRDGSAPAYGEVRAKGPKGRRTLLEAEKEAVKHSDLVGQHLARVVAAVERKANKKYPDNTALVVKIDDYVPFRDDADIADLDELARVRLVPMLSSREFRVLALEGTRNVHLAYAL